MDARCRSGANDDTGADQPFVARRPAKQHEDQTDTAKRASGAIQKSKSWITPPRRRAVAVVDIRLGDRDQVEENAATAEQGHDVQTVRAPTWRNGLLHRHSGRGLGEAPASARVGMPAGFVGGRLARCAARREGGCGSGSGSAARLRLPPRPAPAPAPGSICGSSTFVSTISTLTAESADTAGSGSRARRKARGCGYRLRRGAGHPRWWQTAGSQQSGELGHGGGPVGWRLGHRLADGVGHGGDTPRVAQIGDVHVADAVEDGEHVDVVAVHERRRRSAGVHRGAERVDVPGRRRLPPVNASGGPYAHVTTLAPVVCMETERRRVGRRRSPTAAAHWCRSAARWPASCRGGRCRGCARTPGCRRGSARAHRLELVERAVVFDELAERSVLVVRHDQVRLAGRVVPTS